MKSKKLAGNLIMLTTSIIWGAAFIFQKKGVSDLGPLTFNAARWPMAAFALCILVLLSDRAQKKRGVFTKRTIRGGMITGVFLSVASALQQSGIVESDIGKAGFITALYVIIVPVLSALLFKQKPTRFQWAAVVVGIAGLYLLCIPKGGKIVIVESDVLILLSAVCFSFQMITVNMYIDGEDPFRFSLVQFLTASVICIAGAAVFEDPTVEQISGAMGAMAYCGFVSGGIGYTGQVVGQKFTDPTSASLILCLESVFALVLGWLVLNETMTARELLGSGIMFSAIIMSQIPVHQGGGE